MRSKDERKMKRNEVEKKEPGTELFSQGATPQVSSPPQRFTIEFGMESKWDHCATSTRKTGGRGMNLRRYDCFNRPQDCINLKVMAQSGNGTANN